MMKLKTQLCNTLQARLNGRKAKVPDAGRELLDAFLSLSRARSWHTNGPNPITWEAIAAWSHIMRVPIQPHHAEIIMALDHVWITHVTQRKPEGVKTLPQISSHPLTAELFDVAIS